jgi:uncharacterized membrane protein
MDTLSIELVLLLLNASATLYMAGLIWFVQIVHYPLMGKIGTETYRQYQDLHQRKTTWVVGPPMLIEAFTSVLMVWFPPIPNAALLLLGIALLFLIWVSTALLQIPCHGQLSKGFDAKIHRQLVTTNWIRTLAWTLRAGLVCWFIIEFVRQSSLT